MVKLAMRKKRKNEQNEDFSIPARGDRLYRQDGYWYFKTREGFSIGPFDSVQQAKSGVTDFMDFMHSAEPSVIKRVTDYASRVA